MLVDVCRLFVLSISVPPMRAIFAGRVPFTGSSIELLLASGILQEFVLRVAVRFLLLARLLPLLGKWFVVVCGCCCVV